jgi:SAM-dependent methyltransferase
MLDLAEIKPGSRVLDLAAGDGDQSLSAARRVGPTGYVLATDIAPNFVAFAVQSAGAAGLQNVEAQVMDAENLELEDASFDAVISRLGLMYLPNLQHSLQEIRRVLRPGGRISAIVFSTPERNPFFAIPVSVIRCRAQLPSPTPGQPGPFSLGAPGALEEALREAGFKDVETRLVSAPVYMASATECLRWRQETSGTLQQMLTSLDEAERREVWREIELEFRQLEGAGGFESPCEVVVGAGVNEH